MTVNDKIKMKIIKIKDNIMKYIINLIFLFTYWRLSFIFVYMRRMINIKQNITHTLFVLIFILTI